MASDTLSNKRRLPMIPPYQHPALPAFARLIDPAEGAHAISRFSLLCLKVLTRSEYEHL